MNDVLARETAVVVTIRRKRFITWRGTPAMFDEIERDLARAAAAQNKSLAQFIHETCVDIADCGISADEDECREQAAAVLWKVLATGDLSYREYLGRVDLEFNVALTAQGELSIAVIAPPRLDA